MAKKEFSRFVTPDAEARAVEAAKTTRLRALRLAKEAEVREAAEREAAAKLANAEPRRRARTPHPAGPPAPT
jgi:hypothetical protein